mgnify:CR=1 FL=1
MKQHPFSPACRWIWLHADTSVVNEYVDFRRRFRLQRQPDKARLFIAADSDFQVFVNGTELWGRQYTDYPQERSYSTFDISTHLQPGDNIVAVRAYFRGERFHTYRPGQPGLIVQIEADSTVVVSDRSWVCRRSPSYRSGPVPKVTRQLAFTYAYDARKEDDWLTNAAVSDGWRAAVELAGPTDGFRTSIPPRPLPFLSLSTPVVCRPELSGSLVLSKERPAIAAGPFDWEGEGGELPPAVEMACRYRRVEHRNEPYPVEVPTPTGGGGWFGVFDAGKEEVGLLRIEMDAPAGTVVDIGHGEHLGDLGVRLVCGSGGFADRYVCREGKNLWSYPFRRLGCRYVELHVTGNTRPVSIRKVEIVPTVYKPRTLSTFFCPDGLLVRCREVAIRTLSLCMHDHYEDCPWREQALYAFDSRNQAVYGYYAFGEERFPEESFRLIGKSARDDGLLEMCSPSRIPYTIPSFSLAWICAVRDHYLFSGNPVLLREFDGRIASILEIFLKETDPQTGVVALPTSDVHWIFYEWADGLDCKNGKKLGDTSFRLDAPHNMMLIEAMDAYAEMLSFAGREEECLMWRGRARRLARAVHRFFWDEKRRCYLTFGDRQKRWHLCELTQALALASRVAPKRLVTRLRNLLVSREPDLAHALVPLTLSSMLYLGMAMVGANPSHQTALYTRARDTYGEMLFAGATSLWEVGARDDWSAGASLCHAWSSFPVWLCHAYLLGVHPIEPGFATFGLMPHWAGLPSCGGSVPTPGGTIRVRWECSGEMFDLDIETPRGRVPAFVLPMIPPGWRYRAFLNGKRFAQGRVKTQG